MSSWIRYKEGRNVGKVGAEGNVTLLDEEHPQGVRMTLKRGDNYVSVSCNIYGWIDHTRFFVKVHEAIREYRVMKVAAENIVDLAKSSDSNKIKVWEAISEFVRRFP